MIRHRLFSVSRSLVKWNWTRREFRNSGTRVVCGEARGPPALASPTTASRSQPAESLGPRTKLRLSCPPYLRKRRHHRSTSPTLECCGSRSQIPWQPPRCRSWLPLPRSVPAQPPAGCLGPLEARPEDLPTTPASAPSAPLPHSQLRPPGEALLPPAPPSGRATVCRLKHPAPAPHQQLLRDELHVQLPWPLLGPPVGHKGTRVRKPQLPWMLPPPPSPALTGSPPGSRRRGMAATSWTDCWAQAWAFGGEAKRSPQGWRPPNASVPSQPQSVRIWGSQVPGLPRAHLLPLHDATPCQKLVVDDLDWA